ncbi:MAG: pilin [Candidatus Peregrinibacteria bacterium]
MKKKICYILSVILISLTLAGATASAADSKPTLIPKPNYLPGPSIEDQQKEEGTQNILVNKVLPMLGVGFTGMVGALSLIFLLIGGVRMATSYGNEESIKKGKEQVIYSIVGLLIAILAYAIVSAIINLKIEGDKRTDDELPPTSTEQLS